MAGMVLLQYLIGYVVYSLCGMWIFGEHGFRDEWLASFEGMPKVHHGIKPFIVRLFTFQSCASHKELTFVLAVWIYHVVRADLLGELCVFVLDRFDGRALVDLSHMDRAPLPPAPHQRAFCQRCACAYSSIVYSNNVDRCSAASVSSRSLKCSRSRS